MNFWRLFIYLLIFLILSFFLLKTAFPSVPKLDKIVRICEQLFGWDIKQVSDNEIVISCKTRIPVTDLYKAHTLTVIFETDQQFNVKAEFINGIDIINSDNQLTTNQLTLRPNTGKSEISLTFSFDQNPYPKINRLVKDMEGIALIVTDFGKDKKFKAKIKYLYLQ